MSKYILFPSYIISILQKKARGCSPNEVDCFIQDLTASAQSHCSQFVHWIVSLQLMCSQDMKTFANHKTTGVNQSSQISQFSFPEIKLIFPLNSFLQGVNECLQNSKSDFNVFSFYVSLTLPTALAFSTVYYNITVVFLVRDSCFTL